MKIQSLNNNAVSSREWLETDGRGGFASGTVTGIRTRRYHALVLTAITPPTRRMVLVNGFDAWIESPKGKFALSSQVYSPAVVHPDGARRIDEFTNEPWPTWTYRFEDGTELSQEIFIAQAAQATLLSWRLLSKSEKIKLYVRPFLSGRDYHSLHKENSAFRFEAVPNGEKVLWRPYEGVPGIYAMYSHNGQYRHEPLWYRDFLYEEERDRGLDHTEDLASPGVFEWDLSSGEAVMLLTTDNSPALALKRDGSVAKFSRLLRENERKRRAAFPSKLHKAADTYIVNGIKGKTIIAGYPWFTDWGRDTFIALRGLAIAGGRLEDARQILLSWAGSVSKGMLPNRFPDGGEEPEYNSVDASLWFIVAVHDLFQAHNGRRNGLAPNDRKTLENSIEAILEGYSAGTRFGIRMDDDGLLAAGVPGIQLTWMDAKIGDWVITPRIGKPVEVQALWLNALKIGSQFSPHWKQHYEQGLNSFQERFWDEAHDCLFDVIDVDHQPGRNDSAIRPNQIFSVGGLPFQLLDGERGRKVLRKVQEALLTPVGLRSLAAGESGYAGHYQGGVRERDTAYHQGTVWPWLMGPFVEAWLNVHGRTPETSSELSREFIEPLMQHVEEAGLGHVSEIADAESPFAPRGCPFQAWSLGELMRIHKLLNPGRDKAPVPKMEMITH